jgi:hypothetical protein
MTDAFIPLVTKEAWKYLAGSAVTVVAFAASRLLALLNRRRLLRFFGLSTRCPDIAIYLSNMNVEKTKGRYPVRSSPWDTRGRRYSILS